MTDACNRIQVALKFKILDIIEHMDDNNFELCRLLLQLCKFEIQSKDDQLQIEYAEIFQQYSNTYWIKKKVSEFCAKYRDVYGFVECLSPDDESLENKQIVVDGYEIDPNDLPPHERVISRFTEII